MKLALIAHDGKKADMVAFVMKRMDFFKKKDVELEVRMIDENDILLLSEDEPDFNNRQAGYINTGGMPQMTALPGND